MLTRGEEAISEILGTRASRDEPGSDLFANRHSIREERHTSFRLNPSDGIDRPTIIIPHNNDIEDFFVTVATNYSSATPISSLTHVLGIDVAPLFSPRTKLKAKHVTGSERARRRVLLGAALGEAILYGSASNERRPTATFSSCRRTFAFSLCRAIELHGSRLNPGVLADRWIRLRRLSHLDQSFAAIDASLSIAHLLFDIAPGHWASTLLKPTDIENLDAWTKDGGRLWRRILSSYPGVEVHLPELNGPFDGRLSAFTKIVSAINSNPKGQHSDDVAVAFFCNEILPGSFAHTGVLSKLIQIHPSSMIWYGAFAASGISATGGPEAALLEKLDRDAIESFSFEQRPRCDISLDELEVLSRVTSRPDQIHSSHPRSLLVSILPGVDILARTSTDALPRSEFLGAQITSQSADEIASLLEKALSILNPAGHSPDSRGWTKTRKRK